MRDPNDPLARLGALLDAAGGPYVMSRGPDGIDVVTRIGGAMPDLEGYSQASLKTGKNRRMTTYAKDTPAPPRPVSAPAPRMAASAHAEGPTEKPGRRFPGPIPASMRGTAPGAAGEQSMRAVNRARVGPKPRMAVSPHSDGGYDPGLDAWAADFAAALERRKAMDAPAPLSSRTRGPGKPLSPLPTDLPTQADSRRHFRDEQARRDRRLTAGVIQKRFAGDRPQAQAGGVSVDPAGIRFALAQALGRQVAMDTGPHRIPNGAGPRNTPLLDALRRMAGEGMAFPRAPRPRDAGGLDFGDRGAGVAPTMPRRPLLVPGEIPPMPRASESMPPSIPPVDPVDRLLRVLGETGVLDPNLIERYSGIRAWPQGR